MFLKIANILANVATARFEGIINSVVSSSIHNFMQKGRQTLFIIILSFIFSVLLSAGIIMTLLEMTSQSDIEGITYFSSMLTWSLVLSGLSLLGLIIIFWPRNNNTAFKDVPASTTNVKNVEQPDSVILENLLVVLITEGIQYIKEKNREKPLTNAKNYSPA